MGEIMLGGNAFIVGLARNCAVGLKATLPRIGRFYDTFDKINVCLITNDSNDDTDLVLFNWTKNRGDAQVMQLDGLAKNIPARSPRVAACRNMGVGVLKNELRRGARFDYFVVLDLDGLNEHLVDEPHFSAALRDVPQDWGGVFANQRGRYYDIWALRHRDWCPGDCWQDVRSYRRSPVNWLRHGGQKGARRAALQHFVVERQKVIPPRTPPIDVASAFGGFGIYKVEALAEASYVGLAPNGREICEHVSFNKAVKDNGYGLYISPALLNDQPK